MSLQSIEIDMNALRVVSAISRIGYSTHSAIMDIVDNSITAKATKIIIELVPFEGMIITQKNTSEIIRIIDNGIGINNNRIVDVLRLGSSSDGYEHNSLSKYGLGLKSAGFSLGRCIKIISKQNDVFSSVFYVDIDNITEKYIINSYEITEEERTLYNSKINSKNGTIIEITKTEDSNNMSISGIIKNLTERLGVTYNDFLNNDALKITILCPVLDAIDIRPYDILFEDEAESYYDRDTYTCKKPCISLNETFYLSTNENIQKAELKVVIFPKDRMRNYIGFSNEEREIIKKYKIGKQYKGFFVYRNNRLISWGDNLDGIVGRDDLGFRAKLKIYTCHDEILHVDVSKQRLLVPENILDIIAGMVRQSLKDSREIFTKCDSLFIDDDGTEFNRKNTELSAEDPESDSRRDAVNPDITKRRNKLIEKSKDTNNRNTNTESNDSTEEPVFAKIRYSNEVDSRFLYEAMYHPVYGDYVLINKNHSFYRDVITKLDEKDPLKHSIEAIIWSMAASTNLTYTKVNDVSEQDIEKVFQKFNSVLSTTINNWASINRDLFNNV